MIALFQNRLAYLSLSLVLLVAAFPLISAGTVHGPESLWWLGLLALTCGGLIPPVQRLVWGPPEPPAASAPATDESTPAKGDRQ